MPLFLVLVDAVITLVGRFGDHVHLSCDFGAARFLLRGRFRNLAADRAEAVIIRERDARHRDRANFREALARPDRFGFRSQLPISEAVEDVAIDPVLGRSEERRVGNERVTTRKSRWPPDHQKKHTSNENRKTPWSQRRSKMLSYDS